MHIACFLLSAAFAQATDPIYLPVRVHLIASSLPALDGARATPEQEVQTKFEEINRIFESMGIVWQIESFVVDAPRAEAAFKAAQTGSSRRQIALNALRTAPTRLSPQGFDLYVVQHLWPLDIGGAYQCAAGEPAGSGALFVASRTKSGSPLPTRKWAHEFGHALGLGHTPCDTENRDRLMMSGKCDAAKDGRAGFSADEIERARTQAAVGHAAACHGALSESGD